MSLMGIFLVLTCLVICCYSDGNSLRADFEKAIDGVKMHLLHKSSPGGLLYIGELIAGSSFSPKMVLTLHSDTSYLI